MENDVINLKKRENPEKTQKISTLPTLFPPATPRLELGTLVGTDERFNRSYIGHITLL